MIENNNIFCPPSCGLFGEYVKGACDVCVHSDDEEFSDEVWGILLGMEVVRIMGQSKTEYYLEGGGSILKSSVELE